MLVHGTCQIPDPVYKLVGSIVCFYIPLGVMLLTYYLTVHLLARQQQSLGTTGSAGWASGWLGQAPILRTYLFISLVQFITHFALLPSSVHAFCILSLFERYLFHDYITKHPLTRLVG